MEASPLRSLRNIAVAVSIGIGLFAGTIYFGQFGRGAALLFNMLSYGAISAVVACTKNRNIFGWFMIGFFLALLGVALVLAKEPLSVTAKEAA